MDSTRIKNMPFAKVYPAYIAKIERKGQDKKDLDKIILWMTGYTQKGLEKQIEKETNLHDFFFKAPKLNPKRKLITGVICGIRIENITDKLMKEIRYLDKLVDELAKGKKMEAILRK